MEFKDLNIIKKRDIKVKSGDIFALNPKENIYCF